MTFRTARALLAPRRMALAALLVLASVERAGGGAWTQPRGGFYAKLEAARVRADREFDSHADDVPYAMDMARTRPAVYRNRQLRGYLEYGLLPSLTGIGSASWHLLEVEEPAARHRTWGVSDVRLGARYGLSRGPWVSALQTEAKIPGGYNSDEFPALGTAAADLAFLLQAGTSFPWGYATADLGINFRFGELSDEIPFSLEMGVRPIGRASIRAVVRGRRSLGAMEASGERDLARVDARNLDVAGAIVYGLTPRLDIEAGASRTVSGRNALRGTEFSLGLAAHR